MGCDGGTIPTRDELVRLKKKPEQKDKDAERAAKWKHCSLTQEPLQTPIVACQIGRLYNKDAVIEYLLDKSKFEGVVGFGHIKGLKDIKELQLTDNPGFHSPKSDKGDSGAYTDRHTAAYICPVTGLEMSGRYKFVYLLKCACVFSERAMKEVKSEICHKCGASFVADDIIILNGTEEETEVMRARLEERRAKAKLEKKSKKKVKAEAAEGSASTSSSSSDGPSSSKKAKLEPAHTSKATNGLAKPPGSKLGGAPVATGAKLATSKPKTIQEDDRASKAYKSLFTTSDKAKNQQKAHWVTYNPCFY